MEYLDLGEDLTYSERSINILGKILMSKFLLNLHLQISKPLVYSKIKLLFGKEFILTFGLISPAASQPIRPFNPAAALFSLFNRPFPPPPSPQPAVFFLLPQRSQAHTPQPPAGLAPPHG
jgi:hypothetical protein